MQTSKPLPPATVGEMPRKYMRQNLMKVIVRIWENVVGILKIGSFRTVAKQKLCL